MRELGRLGELRELGELRSIEYMSNCSYIHGMPSETAVKPTLESDEFSCTTPHPLDTADLTMTKARLLATPTVSAIADVFKLLGDPTRVRMLDALTFGERCVCDLAALIGLSESAVSHQLRLLRGARLVRVRRAGRLAYYSLDDHHVIGLLHDTRRHVEEPPDQNESGRADAGRRTTGEYVRKGR